MFIGHEEKCKGHTVTIAESMNCVNSWWKDLGVDLNVRSTQKHSDGAKKL